MRARPGSGGPEEKDSKRNQRDVKQQMAASLRRFGENAEVSDGQLLLDFEEFYAMQPGRIRDKHTASEIRSWFDAADVSNDGRLSLHEFFMFSLSVSAQEYGAATMEKIFRRHDRDRSGLLDALEFSRAMDEMGFGVAAHELFAALDADGRCAYCLR